jgi:cold shock CspA family protein
MATRPLRHGTVREFDEHAGLGVVHADDGTQHPFHCTAIADGTRTIPVGATVTYTVVAGRSGRWEAVQLTRS